MIFLALKDSHSRSPRARGLTHVWPQHRILLRPNMHAPAHQLLFRALTPQLHLVQHQSAGPLQPFGHSFAHNLSGASPSSPKKSPSSPRCFPTFFPEATVWGPDQVRGADPRPGTRIRGEGAGKPRGQARHPLQEGVAGWQRRVAHVIGVARKPKRGGGKGTGSFGQRFMATDPCRDDGFFSAYNAGWQFG